MRLIVLPFVALLGASACTPPPANQMERHARMAAAAELASQKCAGYAGGYESAQAMRADANRNISIARGLGATDAVIEKARRDVNNPFAMQVAFTNQQEACNSLIGNLAWSTE